MTILSSVPGSAFAARSVDINSIHPSRASRKIRLFDGLRAGRGGCLVRAAERAGAQVQELSSLPASHNKAGSREDRLIRPRHFPLIGQYYFTHFMFLFGST